MIAGEQRRLAAIMFTDMVGYSALSQRDDRLALELLEEHRRILREIFPRFNGTEIKTIGDAFLVEFQSALEAAQCAIEIQRALAKRNADVAPDRRIEVKIGIHIGDVVHREGDVYGDGVNIASRIEPLAGAGGVCISMDVERQIRNALETRFEKLGPRDLKNISVPMELFRIVLPWERQAPEVGDRRSEVGKSSALSGFKLWPIAAIVFLLLIGIGWWWSDRKPASPRDQPATRGGDQVANIPEKSIAVLPFDSLSRDPDNAFFAEGVQDEILTNLAKVADLKVISRTSVQQYKNAATRNLREIAQLLGVAHVVEGSVQKNANRVRVIAQLIDARNDAHLWAQTFDRDLADVFAIQSEIADAIARQLQARLSPNEKAEMAKPPTTDPVAYNLYLRARQLDDMANNPDAKPSLIQGISLLEEAVRRDPKFMLAYSLMCETQMDLYWAGFDHTEQRREMARVALQKAEELEPDAGEVHYLKGVYAYHGFREYDRALAEIDLAKKKLPNDARLHMLAGAIERRSGRFREAEADFKRAVELDPRNFIVLLEAGSTFQGLRRYPEAKSLYDRALSVQPDDPFAMFLLGFNGFAQTGDATAFRKPLDLAAQKSPEAARSLAYPLLVCSWMQRSKTESEKAVGLIPAEGIANSFDEALVPREYCVGRTAWLFGDKTLAQSALTAARVIFERTTKEQPEYTQAWSYLGLTDAMLGRCNEAVAEGKRACDLLPFEKDSWVSASWRANLAMIYTWCGDKDAAFAELEREVKLPVGISYGELKQSPDWDGLRDDARFGKILAALAPKP